jgi:uncharacterized membrane protein YiaA
MKEKMLHACGYWLKKIVIISGFLFIVAQTSVKLDHQTIQVLITVISTVEIIARMLRYSLLDNKKNITEKILYTVIFVMTYYPSDIDVKAFDYIIDCSSNCLVRSTTLLILIYIVVYAQKEGERITGVTPFPGREYGKRKATELTRVGKIREKTDKENSDDYTTAVDELIAEDTAIHEAGHAVVTRMCGFKISCISIVSKFESKPDGCFLSTGHVTMDANHYDNLLFLSNDYMRKRAMMSYGGPAADQVFKKITHIPFGSASDIETATQNLKNYWKSKCLINESLIPVKKEALDMEAQKLFIQAIDEKVLEDAKLCFQQAKQIVEDNKELVTTLAKLLIEKKEIHQEEIAEFFNDYYLGKYREEKENERIM